MLITNKIWELRQQNLDELSISSISNQFKISPLISRVILNRGLKNTEEIEKFLYPKVEDFYDSFLMKDMDKAVSRIKEAIDKNEKVIIYGDYDVDGITSTSILLKFLQRFSSNIDFYIPDRIEEGYGLSINSIDKLISKNARLVVTVDCGITAVSEVEYIKEHGIDIIITDHHECKDIIPNSLAVVNPKQKDCGYPFKELAGVGVVFKLIQALAKEMGIASLDVINEYLEIVALGTVADVVPLLDENRVIVKYGLERIAKTTNPGLQSLINISGLQGKPITTTSIGYIIAPRINAAGRIGDPRRGVELFLSTAKEEADQIAVELDQENKNRQQTENIILNQALEMVMSDPEISSQKVLVLGSEGWHHGVIGIVASRITERFYKPAILISLDGEEGKGSGRSIPGFNVFEALTHCADKLEKFGGHELAVGLSVKKENISEFRKAINAYADTILSEEDFYPKVKVDGDLERDDVNLGFINELKVLEPFGMGNPCPVFSYSGLKIVDCRTVGEEKHIKLKIEDEGLYVDAIGFNLGEHASKVNVFDKVDVAASVEVNVWNGQEKIQLNIKDIRTNQEIVFSEKYYSTLENSIFSEVKADINNEAFDKIQVFDGNILSLTDNGQRNVVLINTLKGARKFIETLKKSKGQSKDKFKVYYNYNMGSSHTKNVAIINPYFEGIKLSEFDNVVMYDLCFNRSQYNYLVSNSKNIYLMNDISEHSDNVDVFDDIIPQREELIKVYQFLKSKSWGQSIVSDIFSLTREIAISYGMNLNSLKLKKVLEVFDEMKLIDMQVNDERYTIQIVKQVGPKINIQESKGLAKLLKIKDEFNYFVNYLKKGDIC